MIHIPQIQKESANSLSQRSPLEFPRAKEHMMSNKQDKTLQTSPKKKKSSWHNPFEEMARTFDDFFSQNWLEKWSDDFPLDKESFEKFGTSLKTPRIDIIDKGDTLLVRAEIAGVHKEDIHLHVDENVLYIDGETKQEETVEDKHYHRREIRSGSFHRTVHLPARVEVEQVSASFHNGLLDITLPKCQKDKIPGRKINIQTQSKSA